MLLPYARVTTNVPIGIGILHVIWSMEALDAPIGFIAPAAASGPPMWWSRSGGGGGYLSL